MTLRAALRGVRGACCACLLLLLACAAPPAREAQPSEAQALARALALAQEQPTRAREAFEIFLRAHPRGARAAEVALHLAALQRAEGLRGEAQRTLASALRAHGASPHAPRLRLRLAQAHWDAGHTARAQRTAQALRPEALAGFERSEAELLLAQLAGARGRLHAQLHWLGQLQRAQEPLPAWVAAAAERELAQALAALSEAELEALALRLGAEPPVARVWLSRGARALVRGDLAGAQRALEFARRAPTARGDAEHIAAFESRLALGRGAPLASLPGFDALSEAERVAARVTPELASVPVAGVLGVALPLSGDYADFGLEALQGIALAADLFAPQETQSALRLQIADTRGDAEAAGEAVRALAARPEVVAVIGGLLSRETDAVAEAAARARIPALILGRENFDTARAAVAGASVSGASASPTSRASASSASSVSKAARASASSTPSQAARFDLRLGVAPLAEAERMAQYATETLGLSRFAILYPDLPYGRALRAAFWDAVRERGGTVVSVGRYAADATDFYAPVRRLIGYELLGADARRVLAERERLRKRAKRLPSEQAAVLRAEARALLGPKGELLPPFVDFDALFIPDSYENVGLLAPHLAFHEIRGVRLLGSSPWNAPELLELGGRHLNGAVFSGGSFIASTRASLAAFARRYEERFAAPPGDLAAVAFDAANLVILALGSGASGRAEVLRELRAARAWPGVSGWTTTDAQGVVSRRPHLLGVERARFVSIDERGTPPHLPTPLPFCFPDAEESIAQLAEALAEEGAEVATASALRALQVPPRALPRHVRVARPAWPNALRAGDDARALSDTRRARDEARAPSNVRRAKEDARETSDPWFAEGETRSLPAAWRAMLAAAEESDAPLGGGEAHVTSDARWEAEETRAPSDVQRATSEPRPPPVLAARTPVARSLIFTPIARDEQPCIPLPTLSALETPEEADAEDASPEADAPPETIE